MYIACWHDDTHYSTHFLGDHPSESSMNDDERRQRRRRLNREAQKRCRERKRLSDKQNVLWTSHLFNQSRDT